MQLAPIEPGVAYLLSAGLFFNIFALLTFDKLLLFVILLL
jgi:hypothetical protein